MDMKHYKYLGYAMMAAGMLAATSCSDFSDYNEAKLDSTPSGNLTLWENISQNPQLSEFAQLVKKTGFDSELNNTRYLTVWAPANGTFNRADLETLTDSALLAQFIKSHVAEYGHAATGLLNERVHTLNDKSFTFAGSGNYTFDGVDITATNMPSINGLMHMLNGAARFFPNLYEYIFMAQGVDSLRQQFLKYQRTYLDPDASIKGPMVNGVQTYIDSVLIVVDSEQLPKQSSPFRGVITVGNGVNAGDTISGIVRDHHDVPLVGATVCERNEKGWIVSAAITDHNGRFTLKVVADDNVWFQPFRAVLRTDPAYALTNAAPWTIGHEIRPLGGAAAANTADAAVEVDGNLPGYIYAPGGRGNWNPRLYHEPKQDSAADGVDTGSDDKDPFEDLKSAIYPVNTASAPIEVWWQGAVMQEGMSMPIRFPCVVQSYKAEWPRERDVQNIVIAAQRGSDGQMAGASEAALYLNATTDLALPTSIDGVDPGLDSGLTFGFWVDPSPSGAGSPETTEGVLVTFTPGDGNALAFRLLKEGGRHFVALSTTVSAGTSWTDLASAEVPADEWSFVSLVLDPTEGASRTARFGVDAREVWTGTLSLEVLFDEFMLGLGAWHPLFGGTGVPAATGVALDSMTVWLAPLTVEQLAETWQNMDGASAFDSVRQLHYSFDEAGDLDPLTGLEARFAFDTVGCRRLLSIGPLKLSPGAPHLYSGRIAAGGQVAPEIYWQNDPNAGGFNPNDEHAFLADSPTGEKIVHALRCDLADENGSRPFVLVQYEKGGKGAMRVYGVQLTNAVYSTLGSARTAGLMLTPPHPLDGLDKASNDKNFALTVSAAPTNSFGETTSDSEVVSSSLRSARLSHGSRAPPRTRRTCSRPRRCRGGGT